MSVKVGIVGTGFGTRVVLPCFQAVDGMEVMALATRRPQEFQDLAQTHGLRIVEDVEKMIPLCDLICVETPPFSHADIARKALAAGRHVLCEKPMAHNIDAAKAMNNSAATVSSLAMINHQMRFHPNLAKIKQILSEGRLGPLRHVLVTYLTATRVDPDLPWDWWSERDKGGGQLLALGSHMVDLVRWWLGDVLAVRADLRTGHDVRQHNGQPMPVTSDEMANMMLTMEGDIPVQIITSSLAHHAPGISVHLIGQSGSLVLEGYDHLRLVIDEEEQDVGEVDDLLGEPEVGENPWRTSLVRYGRHIVNALRGDGVFAGATFADGFAVQRVLDAALESHACKKTIVLANRKEFS